MTDTDRKRVFILVSRSAGFSHGLWQGFKRYARTDSSWNIRDKFFYTDDFHALRMEKPDGVIAEIASYQLFDQLTSQHVPFVNVGAPYAAHFPQVLNDDLAIGRMAAEYYFERGYQNYASVMYSDDVADRQIGFFDELKQRGIAPENLYRFNYTSKTDESEVKAWLQSLPKPIAILAFNDDYALVVEEMAIEIGVDIPVQIALMGVDNIEWMDNSAKPTLSSIRSSAERIGFEAASLLKSLMNGDPWPTQPIRIPPIGIVERQSTNHMAVDDPQVASALAYIRNHLEYGFDISKICKEANTGRRSIENKFQSALGKSPLAMFRHLQVNRAKQLLLDTDLAIAAISDQCGFSSPSHFRAAFRNATGMSPAEFRVVNT